MTGAPPLAFTLEGDGRNELEALCALAASETASQEELLQRLRGLLKGYKTQSRGAEVGAKIYRAIPYGDLPKYARELSYAPPDKARLGRCNLQGSPIFYGAPYPAPCLFEIGVHVGQTAVVTKWEVTEKLWLNHAGFDPTVYERLKSARTPEEIRSAMPKDADEASRFYATMSYFFTQEPSDSLYKFTSALFEALTGEVRDPGNKCGRGEKFNIDGIVYPALKMSANSENIALRPEAVDKRLKLVSTQFIRVTEQTGPLQFKSETLHSATKFDDEGKISWHEGPPKWVIRKNGGSLVMQSDGIEWTARDGETGELVCPE